MRARVVLVLLVAVACKDQAPGTPVATTVAVTSPIDSILAVGKTTQLSAAPRDAAGAPVPNLTVTWSSTNATALAVAGTGVLSALTAGTATISASVPGPATGTLRMRAVDADLATIGTLAADAYATALIAAMTPAKRAAVQPAWTMCATGAASGGVVAIMQCGSGIVAEAEPSTDATDRVLVEVLRLYSDEAQRRLGL